MSAPPSSDARERILDAAERAFSEQGLAGARVAAIAAEADVNKAMLYYYYGSKDGLYKAVVERVADAVVAMAEQALGRPDLPPEERLVAFVEGYRDLLASRPKVLRIVIHELMFGGELLLPLVMARASRVLPAFWQCVQQGQAQGSVNPALDFRVTLPALIAPYVLFNAASAFLDGRIPVDPEELRASFNETAMAILRDGAIRPPPPEDA